MPNWTSVPPTDDSHHAYTLKRTPSNRPLLAIVTSDDLLGCDTHYWGGRTVPCERPECKACQASIPYRWHGYVALWDPNTREQFLFEFTARAATALVDYRRTYGTLRGAAICAQRTKQTKNARVEIRCKPADLAKHTLPTAPDLRLALAVIWQLPHRAIDEEPGLDGRPQVRVNGPVRKQLDDPTNLLNLLNAIDPLEKKQ